MNRWITFLEERFPILWIAFLVCGISLSGLMIAKGELHLMSFVLSFIGIVFYFAMMRLIKEVRDIEKDKIAHPDRPLARGLISKKEAVQTIDLLILIFIAYGLIVGILLGAAPGLAFLTIVLYLWLAHKGFYLRKKIERHPLIKGVFYLAGIFPVASFAIAVANPSLSISPQSWAFAVFLFGALACYDICTTLDPRAHPILGTYVQYFGFHRVYYMAAATLILSGVESIFLGVAPLAIPAEVLVLASLSTLFFQPALYRIPDLMSGISLMVHAWAVALMSAFS